MPISSISSNGVIYSRPVKRREPINAVGNISQHTSKTAKARGHGLDNEVDAQSTKKYLPHVRNHPNPEAFATHVERLTDGSGNRATNTYMNIDNMERRQAIKEAFGIDLYV